MKSRRRGNDRKIIKNNHQVWKEKLRQSELNEEQQEEITVFKNKLYKLIEDDKGTSFMSFGNGPIM